MPFYQWGFHIYHWLLHHNLQDPHMITKAKVQEVFDLWDGPNSPLAGAAKAAWVEWRTSKEGGKSNPIGQVRRGLLAVAAVDNPTKC